MLYKKKEIYTNLENQNDIITKKKEIIADNKAHVIIIIINILVVERKPIHFSFVIFLCLLFDYTKGNI